MLSEKISDPESSQKVSELEDVPSSKELTTSVGSSQSSTKGPVKPELYKEFEGYDEYMERRPILHTPPPLPSPLWLAKLRYDFFKTYKRLFGTVFAGNMIGLIIVVSQPRHRTANAIANAVAVNLAAAGLLRLPHIINIFYVVFCNIPKWVPLWIRVIAADVSHFGGVHSGAGFSALCWYITLAAVITRDYVEKTPVQIHDSSVLVITYLVLITIMAIVISAYPTLRFKNHDAFEFTHRFGGWVLTALFWVFIFIFADKESKALGVSLGHQLVKTPSFYFSIVLTIAFTIPWVTLRKVPVRAEKLSNHAVRLHFTHVTTSFAQGIGVSSHPLKDFHNFAGIPYPDGSPGFSCIVSRVGDWTGASIDNGPTKLWKRGIPGSGFGHTIILFKRVVLITTGSGMGPCLSLLTSKARGETRIMWQTRAPKKTYGEGVLELINGIDPKAVVIDTDTHGRHDMFPIAWDIATELNAEAVFVVSRPAVVKDLTFRFQARGIPAFAPIFDQ